MRKPLISLLKNAQLFLLLIGLVMWPALPSYAQEDDVPSQFKLVIMDADSPADNQIQAIIEKNDRFAQMIKVLNSKFVLPGEDITIKFVLASAPHYQPRENVIYIGYDYLKYIKNGLQERYPKKSKADIDSMVYHITKFIVYHEIAHALIDEYELPVLGYEEDAADGLAAIISLEYADDGVSLAMDIAHWFDLESKRVTIKENDLWDEHSLDKQRYYNVLCWVYGKHPVELRKRLVQQREDDLIYFVDAKGQNCKVDYHNIFYSWNKLLKPYMR